jgi:hypothetical protein
MGCLTYSEMNCIFDVDSTGVWQTVIGEGMLHPASQDNSTEVQRNPQTKGL